MSPVKGKQSDEQLDLSSNTFDNKIKQKKMH